MLMIFEDGVRGLGGDGLLCGVERFFSAFSDRFSFGCGLKIFVGSLRHFENVKVSSLREGY